MVECTVFNTGVLPNDYPRKAVTWVTDNQNVLPYIYTYIARNQQNGNKPQ